MREIKFRAWWKGKMEYNVHHNPDVKCELMQFTGLKDKNGKEIYEGDIVATWNDGKDGCDKWYVQDNGYAEVKIDTIYGISISKNGCDWSFNDINSIYALKYLEVMSNIYENPELVK